MGKAVLMVDNEIMGDDVNEQRFQQPSGVLHGDGQGVPWLRQAGEGVYL